MTRKNIGAIFSEATRQVADLERMGSLHETGKEQIAVQALHEFAASIGTTMNPDAIRSGGYGDAWATLQRIYDHGEFDLSEDAWYSSPYSLPMDEDQEPSTATAAPTART